MRRYQIYPLRENEKQSASQGILIISFLLTVLSNTISHFLRDCSFFSFFYKESNNYNNVEGRKRKKASYWGYFSRTQGVRRAGRREREGRGRRGRIQSKETGRQVFIEQQGIFSSGLNDDGRHDRMKNSISNGKVFLQSNYYNQ